MIQGLTHYVQNIFVAQMIFSGKLCFIASLVNDIGHPTINDITKRHTKQVMEQAHIACYIISNEQGTSVCFFR